MQTPHMSVGEAFPENGSASTASASTLVGVNAGLSPAGSAANVSSDSDDAYGYGSPAGGSLAATGADRLGAPATAAAAAQ